MDGVNLQSSGELALASRSQIPVLRYFFLGSAPMHNRMALQIRLRSDWMKTIGAYAKAMGRHRDGGPTVN